MLLFIVTKLWRCQRIRSSFSFLKVTHLYLSNTRSIIRAGRYTLAYVSARMCMSIKKKTKQTPDLVLDLPSISLVRRALELDWDMWLTMWTKLSATCTEKRRDHLLHDIMRHTRTPFSTILGSNSMGTFSCIGQGRWIGSKEWYPKSLQNQSFSVFRKTAPWGIVLLTVSIVLRISCVSFSVSARCFYSSEFFTFKQCPLGKARLILSQGKKR